MIWLLTGIVIAQLIGFLLVAITWPEKRRRDCDFLLRLFLSVGFGFGTVSLLSYIVFFSSRNWAYSCLAEVLLLIGLGYIFFWNYFRNRNSCDAVPRTTSTLSGLRAVLLLLLITTIVLSLANTILLHLQSPHGEWDAWAIWNSRARFLWKGVGFWDDFSNAATTLAHFDYPLLIPLSVARLWYFTNLPTPVAPILVASLFTFATAGLLICATWFLRGPTNALLAGTVLLGTRHFVLVGASQYSDIALSFYFLATICLFLLHDMVWKRSDRLLILAGVSAGLALWTKNEGWLFLLCVAMARCTVTVASDGWRSCLKEMVSFGFGLAPVFAIVVCYKVQFASSNDLVSGDRIHTILAYLMNVPRYLEITKEFGKQVFVFDRWGYVALALLIYPWLVGIQVEEDQRNGLYFGAAVLGLTLSGYFLIYVITPHDLIWHLRHSLDRLYIQLWPSGLMIYFLVVVSPQGTEWLVQPEPIRKTEKHAVATLEEHISR
ncbi:MAG: hypothetical protein ACLQPD_07310 [Desulfomonilaceae bacterium]